MARSAGRTGRLSAVTRRTPARNGVRLEAAAGPRAERAHGEQQGGTERRRRGERHLDEQAPPLEDVLAPLELGAEPVHLLVARSEVMALLGDLVVGHEVLGPHDEPHAEPAGGQRQEDALELGLAALPVHDAQAQSGEQAHPERERGGPLPRRAARVALAPLVLGPLGVGGGDRHERPRAGVVGHPEPGPSDPVRDPPGRAQEQADPQHPDEEPLRDRTEPAQRDPAAVVRVTEVGHVPDEPVELAGRHGLGAEDRHLARPDAHGRCDLRRGGPVQ